MIEHALQLEIVGTFNVEMDRIREAATAPHVLMRPTVVPDGNKWSALYGPNLQEGVCGFGDTPEEACADFDKNWREQRTNAARGGSK